jgi:hypothetical protein
MHATAPGVMRTQGIGACEDCDGLLVLTADAVGKLLASGSNALGESADALEPCLVCIENAIWPISPLLSCVAEWLLEMSGVLLHKASDDGQAAGRPLLGCAVRSWLAVAEAVPVHECSDPPGGWPRPIDDAALTLALEALLAESCEQLDLGSNLAERRTDVELILLKQPLVQGFLNRSGQLGGSAGAICNGTVGFGCLHVPAERLFWDAVISSN